ncbi:MAG: hypothetical protein DIU56_008970 [Pseudomonadota bacterium]|jgi:hypothetical protein|nr:MAG: hypothetical protein DIU56_02435 [Pseudomonadota bacterium]
MSELQRIEFLIQRDGEAAARAWVERTLQIYRDAVALGGHASVPPYRPLFDEAIREFESWLAEHPALSSDA